MRYLKQLFIILAISLTGELLNYLIPMPIPASIYGMAIMLLLLTTGILKLSSVKDTAKFLIDIMPCMFIPAGVGLMTKWTALSELLLPITVTVTITTVIVMATTGITAQTVIRHEKKTAESSNKEV